MSFLWPQSGNRNGNVWNPRFHGGVPLASRHLGMTDIDETSWSLVMADREHSFVPKREAGQAPRNDMADTVGQSHGGSDSRPKASERAVKPGGMVGRETPDKSKEHNTEIAVEAGRHDGAHRGQNR
jgi:hypothetical protein